MKNMRGFTLIELLVVISIIAVLSLIGMAVYSNAQNFAKDTKRKQDLDAIAKAYEQKYDASNQVYQKVEDSDFVSSKKPQDPNGDDYLGWLTQPTNGFYICATLSDNKTSCKSSARGNPPTSLSTNWDCSANTPLPPPPRRAPPCSSAAGGYGDVNGDRWVTCGEEDNDNALALRNTGEVVTDLQKRADTDKNGNVSSVDSLFITKYVLRETDTFTACSN